MSISISPLELWLDEDNPRFVVLEHRDQQSIRKYLTTYEDVCQLAREINETGGLLPGERIVVLQDNDKYVVIEGNRRTCALQFLLNRKLIPDGLAHQIPQTNPDVIQNCQMVNVDVIHDRNTATALMARRHIAGVRQWRPLAKKQFFAARFNSGMSIDNLSYITNIGRTEIRNDIRDYKFFLSTYNTYKLNNPDFSIGIIDLEIDRFLRLFSATFEYPSGCRVRPKTLLQVDYDEQHNTLSGLEESLFKEIILLAFEASVIKRQVGTRNTLIDVKGMKELLDRISSETSHSSETNNNEAPSEEEETAVEELLNDDLEEGNQDSDEAEDTSDTSTQDHSDREDNNDPIIGCGGPPPGGPSPGTFFEHVSWAGKLDPENNDHTGLLFAVHELFNLSRENAGTGRQRDRAYKAFPIATGMVLRTAYEQALILQMKKTSTWENYLASIPSDRFPILSSMENYVGRNINDVLPTATMRSTFNRILRTGQRDLLNATIHNIGEIQITSLTLETLASEGMFTLIQEIIDYRAD